MCSRINWEKMTDKRGRAMFGDIWKCNGNNFLYECSICGSIYNVFPYGSDGKFFCFGSITGVEAHKIKLVESREKEYWDRFPSSRLHQVWEMHPRKIKVSEWNMG